MAKQNRRIRILFTIPNFDTAGSGKALLNIATRLDPESFDPHIMCMHDKGEFFNTVRASNIPIHIHQYTTPIKPYIKGLLNCWKLSRIFKTIRPDIIHSFHYSSDYSEALAARLAGIKWVYTKKNMSWGGGSKNSWRLRSFLARHIIAQNTDMLKLFFPNHKNVTLIPRGVDLNQFTPGQMDPALRAKYRVAEGGRIVICVANLVPVKGVEVLIDAFAQLAPEFPLWKVWIVGDDQNEYGSQLHDKVSELLLGERIIFTGKQPNVKIFLDQAEIFVLPTLNMGRMEGSPVSLLEAMANGKVVLGSEIPGIRDQLKTLKDFIFEPSNMNDLAKKLADLFIKPTSQLREIGIRHMDYCSRNFSIGTEVARHEALYITCF